MRANAWYADFIDAAVDLGLIEAIGTHDPPGGDDHPREACTIVTVRWAVCRQGSSAAGGGHGPPGRTTVMFNAWYYAQMQEATNTHDYEWTGEGDEQIEN